MKHHGSVIIPTLKYKDAPESIEWLCNAFGFEKRLVVPGENGTIVHAQLTFGNAMIMLGSLSDDEYGKLMQIPKNMNGLNTQAPYIIVENIDEHYKNVVNKGVEIVIDIKDEDYEVMKLQEEFLLEKIKK